MRFVEKQDPLDMESYAEWINRLYNEWPIPGNSLKNGRARKKNAGEISITILAEIISFYYPETELLTVYSQDTDAYKFHLGAEKRIKKLLISKTPIPITYKSNDCILYQLFYNKVIDETAVSSLRKGERTIKYSKTQPDHSTAILEETVDKAAFLKLIKEESIHIIF